MTIDDAFWDDIFLGCAWDAYVELAMLTKAPPDSEETRILAYRYYEETLATRNRQRADDTSSALNRTNST